MTDIPIEYQVRLRHVQGDLGPFTLPAQTTMADLGELACSQWPEDGPLLEVKPGSAAEVRLISAGKFIDATQTIQGVASSLGPLPPDVILTLHLIVRPIQASSKGSKGGKGGDGLSSSDSRCCTCVIS